MNIARLNQAAMPTTFGQESMQQRRGVEDAIRWN